MDEAQIRVAGPDDAPALVDLGARTFRDTYRGLMPVEPLEAYIADTFTLARLRDELRDPRNVHFLVERDGVAVGYDKLRDGPSPVVTAAPIELERIYVERSATGGGLGRRLLETALRTAAAMGRETMWLGRVRTGTRPPGVLRADGLHRDRRASVRDRRPRAARPHPRATRRAGREPGP